MIDKKGIKQREKIIIILIIVAVIIFALQRYYVHLIDEKQNKYLNDQQEVTTCDLDYIMEYKNLYMGNASNLGNLFRRLPLRVSIKDFQLFPNELTAQINFNDSELNVGRASLESKNTAVTGTVEDIHAIYQNEVNKSLSYNAIATFALIDNLEGIIYKFTDITYTVTRDDIEAIYVNLDNLLEKDTWNKVIRDPFGDKEYVIELAEKILKH